jgi:hypothetical protein
MSRVYVIRLIRDYSSDFLATTRLCLLLCIWDTQILPQETAVKAGTPFRSGEDTGSSWECHGKARRKWGWLQHVIAEHKTHLIMEVLRVQKVEFALQQETLTA